MNLLLEKPDVFEAMASVCEEYAREDIEWVKVRRA